MNYTMEPELSAAYELLREVLVETTNPSYSEASTRVLRVAQESEHYGLPISALPLLACEIAGAEAKEAVPVTAAWRALHIAAKLLDDVEDGCATNGETVLSAVDRRVQLAQSINLSTGFITAASLLIHKLNEVSRLPVQHDFSRAVLRMVGGQHNDLSNLGQLTLEEYFGIMEDKSGAFFALATRAGAICGRANSKLVTGLEQFGHCVGMLVQVMDDWADWYKPAGQSDLSRGKITLPVYYAFTVGSADEQQIVRRLLANSPRDPQAESTLQDLLKSIGVDHFMRTELEFYRRRAERTLQEWELLPGSTDKLRSWLQDLLAKGRGAGGGHTQESTFVPS